ncbi:unnamed protein product, partial [Polarella glacialis]
MERRKLVPRFMDFKPSITGVFIFGHIFQYFLCSSPCWKSVRRCVCSDMFTHSAKNAGGDVFFLGKKRRAVSPADFDKFDSKLEKSASHLLSARRRSAASDANKGHCFEVECFRQVSA